VADPTAVEAAARVQRRRDELILPITGLAFAAGCIHAVAMVDHFSEYWLFGLFFAVVTPLQLVWGAAVYLRPTDDGLLRIGAIGNVLVAGVWVLSRTLGLPFGPEPWDAEAVGLSGVLATLDELAIGVIAAVAVAHGRSGLVLGVRRFGYHAAFALTAASLLGALTVGHSH
jgi:hypothetical protein